MASLPDPGGERTANWSLEPRTGAGRQRPYLLVMAGPQIGQMVLLERGREQVLGRGAGSEIVIRDAGVSRRHATLFAAADGARLRDLGSQNGTWVDGVRVSDCRLQDGQRIQVGIDTTLKFCLSDELEIEYQRRLAEGSLHEPLTGLFNQRHFRDRLHAELAAVQRHSRALSLLLLDVDGFDRVSAAHGRTAGDEALKMVAHVMQGAVRREDVLARLGGEDFAVLARETPLAGGRALGERIRKAVERSRVSYRGEELALTVSVGVAVVASLPTFEPGKSDAALMDAAEAALEEARRSGGNCVSASPVGPAPPPAAGPGPAPARTG
jgi:diguanylate cyclase (GGDEF)-like protein